MSKHAIKTLVRQCAKYATMAQQDASPMLAVLHANYSMGYLYALQDIAKDNEIQAATGVDVNVFREHILQVQEEVSKKIIEKIPELQANTDLFLSAIAADTI